TITNSTGPAIATGLLIPQANAGIGGFVGGGRVGVNYQAGAFVFGYEADIAGMTLKGQAATTISGTATTTTPGPTVFTTTVKYHTASAYRTTADWSSTFTGRVGYAFDRILAYGKLGAAVEQDEETENSATTTCIGTTTTGMTTIPSTTTCNPVS